MSLPDKCPTCLRMERNSPASIRQSLGRDVETRQAEADRLATRLAALEARCKRLEEAGDALQSAVVGTEGMTHWQWLAAAHEADLRWRKAKEAKP